MRAQAPGAQLIPPPGGGTGSFKQVFLGQRAGRSHTAMMFREAEP